MSFPRVVLAAAVALVTIVGISACAPEDTTPTPGASGTTVTPSPTSSAEPSTEPTAVPPAAAGLTGTRVSQSCDTLISPQAMYDFNPNYGLADTFSPRAGSPAATIAALNGRVCRWINQTSGEVIELAVAQPAPFTTAIESRAAVSASVGTGAYFRLAGGFGESDTFADPYWISIVSDYFLEQADSAPLVSAVRSALGK